MQKLINWLETSFAPKMNKINHNVWVVTLKDSVMQILPFICWVLFSALVLLLKIMLLYRSHSGLHLDGQWVWFQY